MNTLLISGDTLQKWDVDEILTNKVKSKDRDLFDMIQYDWDNTVSRSGMTYLEIEQFDNKYNNFR